MFATDTDQDKLAIQPRDWKGKWNEKEQTDSEVSWII